MGRLESALTGGDQVTRVGPGGRRGQRCADRQPALAPWWVGSQVADLGGDRQRHRRACGNPGDVEVAADDGGAVVLDHPAEPEVVEIADVVLVRDGHGPGGGVDLESDRSHHRLELGETRPRRPVRRDEAVEAVATAVGTVGDVAAVQDEGFAVGVVRVESVVDPLPDEPALAAARAVSKSRWYSASSARPVAHGVRVLAQDERQSRAAARPAPASLQRRLGRAGRSASTSACGRTSGCRRRCRRRTDRPRSGSAGTGRARGSTPAIARQFAPDAGTRCPATT